MTIKFVATYGIGGGEIDVEFFTNEQAFLLARDAAEDALDEIGPWDGEASYTEGEVEPPQEVWVLTYWFEGDEIQTQVFHDETAAATAALGAAMTLWDSYWEAHTDWPIQPETWEQIYDEVLNRTGNIADFIILENHTIR